MWEDDHGIDVTSAFVGITAPVRELYDEIHKRGWEASTDIQQHQYVAAGKNPHGETVEKTGPNEQTALANLLVWIMRHETIRHETHVKKFGMWDLSFESRIVEIANAYTDAPVYDPKTAPYWKELADDCTRRAEHLHDQLTVDITADPNPYKSVNEMREDVLQKRHIFITTARPEHPVWSVEQMLAFRLCHDVLGHVAAGGDWGWHGSNLAFAAHAPLLAPEAQAALFTETLGQVAYANVYRDLGPQKIAVLSVFEHQNGPAHTPVHPSQTIAPSAIPDINEATLPKEGRLASLVASATIADPNLGWQSGLPPLPDNGFLWQRDPQTGVDPLDVNGLRENAARMETDWHDKDPMTQRQAIANAFRGVLMQPRKDGRQAAVHYQHLAQLPASVQDPVDFWRTLEEQRTNWNGARGYDTAAPYWRELQQFKQWLRAFNPTLDDREVQRKAETELHHMLMEEEERVLMDDPDETLPAQEIEPLVWKGLAKRLKTLTKPRLDQKYDFGESQLYHDSSLNLSADRYGGHLNSHLRPLAQVGRFIDTLHDAARKDLALNGGKGHHFRSTALALNIPGIGPKQASNAWLHLQPRTSELAVLDPHLLETLGHKPEEMNDRDYFKYERELAAGRDAAGYNHVPLGLFGWGMWDQKRGGPGFHLDHSALRPLNPQPWDQIDWQQRVLPEDSKWTAPYWWDSTEPYRDEVAKDWDRNIAVANPAHEIPFQRTSNEVPPSPYFIHPNDGILYEGEPGMSLMQHLRQTLSLPVEQIWQMNLPDIGKH